MLAVDRNQSIQIRMDQASTPSRAVSMRMNELARDSRLGFSPVQLFQRISVLALQTHNHGRYPNSTTHSLLDVRPNTSII